MRKHGRVARLVAAFGCALSGALGGCGGSEAASPARPDSTLVALLAEIQPRVERSSGIEARAPVRVARADERRLRSYLREQLALELPPEKTVALSAAYGRFGLLPDTLDLSALLGELLQEQVVGYYDPESDTLFVLERVPEAQLAPVLAHELVHALQDQRVDLDSLGAAVRDRNDAAIAAHAAIEGHAMFAMLEWQMGEMAGGTVDLTALADLGEMLQGVDVTTLAEGTAPVEVLRSAPTVIREGLIFPYLEGLFFVQRMWRARDGRPLPFGADLPRSTEQVLHVDRYLAGDEPTAVRFVESPPAGWTQVMADGLGEHETRIFLAEHLGDPERAERAAVGWDGDAYRLVRGAEGEALVWVTVWDAPGEADEFAAAARDAWARRYEGAAGSPGRSPRVERTEIASRPAVVTFDLPGGASPALGAGLARVTLSGS